MARIFTLFFQEIMRIVRINNQTNVQVKSKSHTE